MASLVLTGACSLASTAGMTGGQWGTESGLFSRDLSREIQSPEGPSSSREGALPTKAPRLHTPSSQGTQGLFIQRSGFPGCPHNPIHWHRTLDGKELGPAQNLVPGFVAKFHTWHPPELTH